MVSEEGVARGHHRAEFLTGHDIGGDQDDVGGVHMRLVEHGCDIRPDRLCLLAQTLGDGSVRSRGHDTGGMEPSRCALGDHRVGIVGSGSSDGGGIDLTIHRISLAPCHDGSVRKYVIMGVQGSGKGTHAMRLASEFALEHISVGDIFRWNIQHHTKLGAQVKRVVDCGDLVGDDLVESVVRDRLEQHDWNYGFVIDGFPRNATQAEFFLERYDIDGVINLVMPDEEVERRVLARRLCSQCGLDYNLIAHRPEIDDTCDVCGGRLVVRDDDNPEALARRLAAYHAKTAPVIELFERKEFVVAVDAMCSKDEVFADICNQLAHGPAR